MPAHEIIDIDSELCSVVRDIDHFAVFAVCLWGESIEEPVLAVLNWERAQGAREESLVKSE